MKLGVFSVSLSVKDLAKSKEFYEGIGFHVLSGDMDKNYLIMQSETTLIGLFQGMFEGNILTFNPGWDHNGNAVGDFEDVRSLQHKIKENGVKLDLDTDPEGKGIGHIVFSDPDGNVIMIDQHVAAPE